MTAKLRPLPCLWIYGRVAMAASSLACRVLWHVAIASLIREKRTISCRVTTTQSCDQMLATSIRMPEIKQQTSVIYISLLWTNLSHSDNHKKTNSQYFGCLVKLALLLCSKYSSISQNSCLLFSWDWCGFSVHSITCWYSPSCLSYCPQTFARSRSLSVSVSVLMTCLCSFWGEFSCSWSVLRQSWKPLLWLFCGQSHGKWEVRRNNDLGAVWDPHRRQHAGLLVYLGSDTHTHQPLLLGLLFTYKPQKKKRAHGGEKLTQRNRRMHPHLFILGNKTVSDLQKPS